MNTLKKLSKGQEDLMDKKYFISPNRYGVQWKLMKSQFGDTLKSEINTGNTISIKSPKKYIPHEFSYNKIGLKEAIKQNPAMLKNRINLFQL